MVERVTSKIFIVIGVEDGHEWVVRAYRDEEVALDGAWFAERESEDAGLFTRFAVHECELVEVMPSMEP